MPHMPPATCGSTATPAFTLLPSGAVLLVNRPELDATLLRLVNSASHARPEDIARLIHATPVA